MFRKSILAMAAVAVIGIAGSADAQSHFKRGDANNDSAINIGDAVFVLGFLFSGGAAPACSDAADVNDDGALNIADAVALLGFLFSGGAQPPEPFDIWEGDPTADALTCKPVVPASILTGDIVADLVLTKDRTWRLQSGVFIKDGVTLTIQPGTTIVGENATDGLLCIERGGQLVANGTPILPIVFTSENPVGSRARGDWGGLVLLGNGPNNFPTGEAFVEGLTNVTFGGGNNPVPDEATISMQYCRVDWGGTEISPNNEINAITAGSLGTGTVMHHIQCSWNLDDGIEWFGGGASVKYAVTFGIDDDCFDGSFGWNGNVQFIAGVKRNGGDNGLEFDNSEPGLHPLDSLPRTNQNVFNFTLVGALSSGTGSAAGEGGQIRRGAAGNWRNGIVENWLGNGWEIDDADSMCAILNDGNIHDGISFANNGPRDANNSVRVCSVLFPGLPDLSTEGFLTTAPNTNNELVINGTTPTSRLLGFVPGNTDFLRPDAGLVGPALANPGGFFDAANYRGAVDPNAATANWLNASWISWREN